MSLLLKEIQEELREEAFLKLVLRYGKPIIIGVVALLLAFGGWRLVSYRAHKHAEKQSAFFQQGLQAMDSGNLDAAQTIFQKLMDDQKLKGYGLLSHLAMISLAQKRLEKTYNTDWLVYAQNHTASLLGLLKEKNERSMASLVALARGYYHHYYRAFGRLKQDAQTVSGNWSEFQTPQNPWYGLASEIEMLDVVSTFPAALQTPQARQAFFALRQKLQDLLSKGLGSAFIQPSVRTRLELMGVAMGLSLVKKEA